MCRLWVGTAINYFCMNIQRSSRYGAYKGARKLHLIHSSLCSLPVRSYTAIGVPVCRIESSIWYRVLITLSYLTPNSCCIVHFLVAFLFQNFHSYRPLLLQKPWTFSAWLRYVFKHSIFFLYQKRYGNTKYLADSRKCVGVSPFAQFQSSGT